MTCLELLQLSMLKLSQTAQNLGEAVYANSAVRNKAIGGFFAAPLFSGAPGDDGPSHSSRNELER